MSVSVENRRRWTIDTHLPVSYGIIETTDLFNPENLELLHTTERGISKRPRLVVVDENVHRLYGTHVTNYFTSLSVEHTVLAIPGDEQNKTIDNALNVVSLLNTLGATRRADPPIAIGGGVVLDVVGLAASLFRRGIPYIRVPTTLLGIVDVSVAAKTGVNYEGFRNRLGSYSPPPLTLIDKTFLETLPIRQLRNGMGEVLKLGAIKDKILFDLIERTGRRLIETGFRDAPEADEVIGRSIQGMAEELADNLWERTLERCVDFGHSFSPLIEMTAIPELLHGEAVTLDCIFSSFLALHRGHLSEHDVARLIDVAIDLGLPTSHQLFADSDMLRRALDDTKRHRNGNQNLPLMAGVGEFVFVNDVSDAEINRAAEAMATLLEDSSQGKRTV